jgi:hypothetical protein
MKELILTGLFKEVNRTEPFPFNKTSLPKPMVCGLILALYSIE